MKTFQVISGHRYNPVTQTVQLNGIAPNKRLTPRLARRACQIAIGLDYGAMVWDESGTTGYALYRASSRKVHAQNI